MNPSATIKLFLPLGDPKRVRTAEISNWSGKAVAAPRSDLDLFLNRRELLQPGVYLLLGEDPESGKQVAYVGEAEIVLDRIKQHRSKEYWNSAIAFVSKDENLTRAHIRYLEGRIIEIASQVGRYSLINSNNSGAHLPESDLHDMEVYLERVGQLLPVLGSELLTPVKPITTPSQPSEVLISRIKNAEARGMRSPNGFVVLAGSTAVLHERQSGKTHGAWILKLRHQLIENGTLQPHNGLLTFIKDVEFSSPSAAAGVIRGGTAPGPVSWKDHSGRTLKEIEGDS
ncbi:GIY-YIG nuclease family protein [Metapseudomonas otitidis]|uniref:GIY-YIG nuclease family protein n=1 Tax=Metapseudomonas otitidis TaxID=319939 RepID=UPI00280B0217|nr:GIY-YIG nuclease family protein [Pseudomonas otitidis]